MAETVATQTHARGREAARSRFGRFLVVALALHLPLTPIGPLLGLLALLAHRGRETPAEQLNSIPVSLLSQSEMDQLGMTEAQKPAEAPPVPPAGAEEPGAGAEPPPKPKPRPRPKPAAVVPPERDGGAPPRPPPPSPDAGADGGPVPLPAAPSAPAAPGPSVPRADAGPLVARPAPGPGDPLALAGRASSVTDPNANLRFLLLNDKIRPLPIAARIGKLVARLPQWRSFFGPTSLDPIRDIDRLFVTGPQFRVSSEVVAVVKYSAPEKAVRKAIDAIVAREPKGEWLASKVPAARARADRADRVFVLAKPGLLMMVPPHLKDDAIDKAPGLDLPSPSGPAALIAFIASPWRALIGLGAPVELPRSIQKVILTAIPEEGGGAVLHIDATDGSPAEASAHAATLTAAVNALTQQNLGAVGALLFGKSRVSFIEPVNLIAVGSSIRGDARVTPAQLDRLIGFAEGWVDSLEGPAVSPAPPAGSGPVRQPVSPGSPPKGP